MTFEELIEEHPDILLADGFDDCVVGIGWSFNRPPVAVYDREAMIAKMAADMSWEEAEDFYYFNIEGSYLGDRTPIYMEKISR